MFKTNIWEENIDWNGVIFPVTRSDVKKYD